MSNQYIVAYKREWVNSLMPVAHFVGSIKEIQVQRNEHNRMVVTMDDAQKQKLEECYGQYLAIEDITWHGTTV